MSSQPETSYLTIELTPEQIGDLSLLEAKGRPTRDDMDGDGIPYERGRRGSGTPRGGGTGASVAAAAKGLRDGQSKKVGDWIVKRHGNEWWAIDDYDHYSIGKANGDVNTLEELSRRIDARERSKAKERAEDAARLEKLRAKRAAGEPKRTPSSPGTGSRGWMDDPGNGLDARMRRR